MYLIVDTTTDPAWNLAVEEYLLAQRDEPFFRLWRNADSVIIGRHQNAYAEIDLAYVERERIPVIRRMTGGGAVFHEANLRRKAVALAAILAGVAILCLAKQ